MPLEPPMLAPAGAPTSENVSVCAGRSASVAVAVNVYGESSGVLAVGGTPARIGASVFATPSLTRTWNGYTPGPCASVGVQLKTPVEPSILAPAGASTRENV